MKPILVWFVIEILKVVRHWYLIEKKHVSPNKVISFVIRAVLLLVIISHDDYTNFVTWGAYIFGGWFIHDYLLNILRGVRPIFYLNSTGAIDKLQAANPYVAFWFKAIFVLIFVGAYFFND